MKKYLDIAKTEKVLIQRGRNETFVLVAQNNAAEEDLSRAITVDVRLASGKGKIPSALFL